MKTPDLAGQKLKLIELILRVEDEAILHKLQAILLKAAVKERKSTAVTDELLRALDQGWSEYKDAGPKAIAAKVKSAKPPRRPGRKRR